MGNDHDQFDEHDSIGKMVLHLVSMMAGVILLAVLTVTALGYLAEMFFAK